MKINIKAHHVSAPDAVRAYATEKFARLERFHPHLREVEVLFKENGPQGMECDVHLHMDHKSTQIVCCTAGDLNSAIDMALDRCERQLVRLKEKMKSHKTSASGRFLTPPDAGGDDADDDDE